MKVRISLTNRSCTANIRAYEPDFRIDEAGFSKTYLDIMQL